MMHLLQLNLCFKINGMVILYMHIIAISYVHTYVCVIIVVEDKVYAYYCVMHVNPFPLTQMFNIFHFFPISMYVHIILYMHQLCMCV